MPRPQTDGPTVVLSFANNFWGKNDAGVGPMFERMHSAKITCDELRSFYSTRAAIEDEYARKLLSLCRKPLGSCEAGTLRASLDIVRGETESVAKAHTAISSQMKTELEEPLAAFAGGMKERRKIVQHGIERLLKVKIQQTHTVNKARDRYEQDCLRVKGYLAQGHMVMGQEERKNKAKLEKTQIQLASNSGEYEVAVKVLEETTGRWNKEWKAACDKFQDLEEERLDFTKGSLWSYANIASTVCVSDDASCEKIRLSLEDCEVEKDINFFIKLSGTGQEIPDPPRYINFCRGDINDTSSETSEEEQSYSVAQFQRPINPAFRSSSPQPSTYESHHDPHSELAVQMAQNGSSVLSNVETKATSQKPPRQLIQPTQPAPLDIRRGGQLPPNYHPSEHGEIPTVPHNSYPTEGMTMFCRTGPPSDRSSGTSAYRPSSQDSQSDASNHTSFSNQEPPSRKQYPSNPIDGIPTPRIAADKQVQKRRSAFFSNSPFRRKSKHEKDRQPVTTRPGFRSTWDQSLRQNRSPKTGYAVPLPTDRLSGSPEPVDPRATFQLNIGNNIFDVASPDTKDPQINKDAEEEPDPIARALADLKEVGKPSINRVSADRYHGIVTPVPSTAGSTYGPGPVAETPPPAYNDTTIKHLDAPQPAFTSAQMQKTTQKYIGQTQTMFGSPTNNPRVGERGNMQAQEAPRARSPTPRRSASPQSTLRVDNARIDQNSGVGSQSITQYNNSIVKSRPYGSGTKNTSRYSESPGQSPTRYGANISQASGQHSGGAAQDASKNSELTSKKTPQYIGNLTQTPLGKYSGATSQSTMQYASSTSRNTIQTGASAGRSDVQYDENSIKSSHQHKIARHEDVNHNEISSRNGKHSNEGIPQTTIQYAKDTTQNREGVSENTVSYIRSSNQSASKHARDTSQSLEKYNENPVQSTSPHNGSPSQVTAQQTVGESQTPVKYKEKSSQKIVQYGGGTRSGITQHITASSQSTAKSSDCTNQGSTQHSRRLSQNPTQPITETIQKTVKPSDATSQTVPQHVAAEASQKGVKSSESTSQGTTQHNERLSQTVPQHTYTMEASRTAVKSSENASQGAIQYNEQLRQAIPQHISAEASQKAVKSSENTGQGATNHSERLSQTVPQYTNTAETSRNAVKSENNNDQLSQTIPQDTAEASRNTVKSGGNTSRLSQTIPQYAHTMEASRNTVKSSENTTQGTAQYNKRLSQTIPQHTAEASQKAAKSNENTSQATTQYSKRLSQTLPQHPAETSQTTVKSGENISQGTTQYDGRPGQTPKYTGGTGTSTVRSSDNASQGTTQYNGKFGQGTAQPGRRPSKSTDQHSTLNASSPSGNNSQSANQRSRRLSPSPTQYGRPGLSATQQAERPSQSMAHSSGKPSQSTAQQTGRLGQSSPQMSGRSNHNTNRHPQSVPKYSSNVSPNASEYNGNQYSGKPSQSTTQYTEDSSPSAARNSGNTSKSPANYTGDIDQGAAKCSESSSQSTTQCPSKENQSTAQHSGGSPSQDTPAYSDGPSQRATQHSRGSSQTTTSYQSSGQNSSYRQSPTTSSRLGSERGYSPRQFSRHGSPNDLARGASPQPQFRQQNRPSSAGGMELQLSASPLDPFGNSFDGSGSRGSAGAERPRSMYYEATPETGSRSRSKSLAVVDPGRQFSRDGRPILYYARALYNYTAAIPEELGFSKGDILAIIRLQDDGWWEAEVTSTHGRPGLVPGNYLQNL